MADIIAPDGYRIHEDHIRIGGSRWVRSICITQIPNRVRIGWLDRLFSIGDVDVSIYLEKGKENEVLTALNREILDLETKLEQARRSYDTTQLSRLRKAHKDAWSLREAIQLGDNAMCYVTIVANVAADSRQELDHKCRMLEERLSGRGIHIREAFLQQADAYRSALPYGINFLEDSFRKNLDIGAATAGFPFNQADLAHENGIYIGTNLQTGGPVFLNGFLPPPAFSNNHMNIFAKSGGGKTTAIKEIVTRSLPQDIRSVILDWKGEYGIVTDALGIGINIVLSQSGERYILNIFEINEDVDEKGSRALYLNEHIATVKGLLTALISQAHKLELTIDEKVYLEEAIKEEYEAKGIHEGKPDSIYTSTPQRTGEESFILGKRKKEMPTISSLYERLSLNEAASRLCKCLSIFKHGQSLGLFDGQTTVDLQGEPIINLDLSRLEEHTARPMANQVVLHWVWQEFIKRDRTVLKRVIAEEAWSYLQREETATFLAKLAKTARAYTCSLTVSSQDFKEFAIHPIGSSVITNASQTILGLQEESDLEYIYEKYQLSEGEKRQLVKFKPGEMLIRLENAGSTLVKVERAEFEKPFISSSYLEERAGAG
ncbi:MAG: DUF87 domain-containing protein [Firmicutes bacterium]|nr:DUF87 domain-containing protein [Bacillota bacterium]